MILAIAEEDKQRTAGLVQLSMIQFRKKLARQVPDFYRGVSSEQQIQLCFRQHQTKKKIRKDFKHRTCSGLNHVRLPSRCKNGVNILDLNDTPILYLPLHFCIPRRQRL